MSSYQIEERAYMDFAYATIDIVVSYGRRSTANNTESSNIHIENQVKLNKQCINNTIAKGVKVVDKVYNDPQSGFLPYSRSYAKKMARTIKASPKGSKVVIVVSSLGRISREYKTIVKLQKDLKDYDVFIQFSSTKYEKPKVNGVDYKILRLSDVQEQDLVFYKEEIKTRVNPLQEERVKLAIKLLNLGMHTRDVYKKCGIWQGAIRAYQAKHPVEGRILRGDGRLYKSRKVIDLYNLYDMTVEAIAKKVGYSVRNVYYIMAKHKEAMARLQDLKALKALKASQKSLNDSEKVSNTSPEIDPIEHKKSDIERVDKHRDKDG